MRCYVGAGSNVGDRLKNIQEAVFLMRQGGNITLRRISPVYETTPQGGPENQRDYLNLVLEMDSRLSPEKLFMLLKNTERKIGRKSRLLPWSEREIDLDLLLYGNRVLKTDRLVIPHPLMHQRRFVLQPLADLDPQLQHPVFKETIEELLKKLNEQGKVEKIEEIVSFV